jgi:serine/threonine-protein kinase
MGEVYRAYDPTLARFIALKLLPGPSASHFLREARAQARVDHESVCKVFEVGELAGVSYIAMRHVPGASLDAAASVFPLETQVRLFRQVAEALHAAHREGLVHRDVKPGNVIVEAGEEGVPRACVVDFGLALEQERSQSVTQQAAGTPAYMAPEQARGEMNRIDRRTDVYGLGVTMWEVLAGEPMVKGTSVVEILLKVVHDEPRPILAKRPGMPADLATIIMKCVEKEPEKRYDSARALAEDLGRFLDGEPISARPVGTFGRLLKRARKHKALTAAISIAVLSALGFGGTAVVTSLQSVRRQAAAQEIGQAIERMEWTLRQAYFLPVHDIRPARRKVEDQMLRLKDLIERRGKPAEGPGHYALGRGHLDLGHLDEARNEIEMARSAGYDTADSAFALGRTLIEMYRRERKKAGLIPNKEAKAARLEKIKADLERPAIAALRSGREADGTALLEGLLADLEERPEDARKKFTTAFEKDPALYEAVKLNGDVEAQLGRSLKDVGEIEKALAAFEEAGRAYRAAAEIGRSDPRLYIAECDRLLLRFELEIRTGRDETAAYAAGRAACQTALTVDPTSAEAYSILCRYEWQLADALGLRGVDEGPALERAISAGQQSVTLNPSYAEGWANLGIAFWSQSEAAARHGGDPRPSLKRAAEALSRSERLEPTGAHVMDLGSVLLETGRAAMKRGEDPRPFLAEAEKTYEGALKLMPREARLQSNIGNIAKLRADYDAGAGRDPIPALEDAVRRYEKAIELNPKNPIAFYNLGQAFYSRARAEASARRDPAPFVKRGFEANQHSLQVNPKLVHAQAAMAEGHLILAEDAAHKGRDPGPSYREALKSAEAALALNPNFDPARKMLATTKKELEARGGKK